MFQISRGLRYALRILVGLIWIFSAFCFLLLTRIRLLLTWLAVLPDWLARIAISFVASPGFIILSCILVGLSSLLLWHRFSNKWATIFAILIPFLLFIGTVLYGDIDTQGTQRYVTDVAQRGDVRSTREQMLIRSGLGGSLNELKALIHVGTNVNVRDPEGRSALYWAGGEPEKIKLLLQAGAKPDGRALVNAAFWGNLDAIKLMFEATPDDGKALVTEVGNQALMANKTYTNASAEDRAQIARMLIARGAKSNDQK
ncbi:ankyrin repeat domain-containing protein [Nostoc sp.]